MVEPIKEGYQTSDGCIFTAYELAELHQWRLDFFNLINDDSPPSIDLNDATSQFDFHVWVKRNKKVLENFLNTL